MEAGAIKGANRVMQPPPGWDAAKNGPCAALPVLDTGEFFQSAWIPDNLELACLNAGSAVIVTIWGRSLPPHGVGTMPQPGFIPEEAYEQAIDALKRLAFMARTSGGTAGEDAALARACEVAEAIVGPLPADARREPQDRNNAEKRRYGCKHCERTFDTVAQRVAHEATCGPVPVDRGSA